MRQYFRLKEFRSEFDLKQSDVAELFKCHQTNISRIESQFCDLEDYQYKILCSKYGQDAVDKYKVVGDTGTSKQIKAQIMQNGNNGMGARESEVDVWNIINSQKNQINSLIEQNRTLIDAVANLTKLLDRTKVG